jgi:hypothetical protein
LEVWGTEKIYRQMDVLGVRKRRVCLFDEFRREVSMFSTMKHSRIVDLKGSFSSFSLLSWACDCYWGPTNPQTPKNPNLQTSNPQKSKNPNLQTPKPPNPKPPNLQTSKPPNPQTPKPPNFQTSKPPNPQTPKPSNPQTLKPSNPQTLTP